MGFVGVPGPQQVLRISRVLRLDVTGLCGLLSCLSSQLSAPRPHVDINKNRQVAAAGGGPPEPRRWIWVGREGREVGRAEILWLFIDVGTQIRF